MSYRERIEQYIAVEAKPVDKYGHQPRLYALTRRIGNGLMYDDDVVHGGHSTRVQNFLPRVSHVPRNVIQNESRISRRSSQNDWRLMYTLSYLNLWRRMTSRGA